MCHNIGDGHISGLPLLLQLPLSSWDPAGRSRDKPKVLCLGFQCHLMFTWDQRAPKVLLWLVPCRALWHLPVAIPPSQGLFASCSLQPHPPSSFPAALPPHLSLCSFSLYPEAEAALLSFPVPPACAASSSHHCYLWLTCAHTEGLFTSLLVIHRVWGALQMNRSHNCSLLEQPPPITSPCLHFCVSFTSSLWISVCSWGQCFNSRSCCGQLYLAVLSGSLYLPGTQGLGRVAQSGFYGRFLFTICLTEKISFSVSTRGLVFASFVSFQMQSQKHRRGCEALEGRKGFLKQLFCPAKKHIVPVWALQET